MAKFRAEGERGVRIMGLLAGAARPALEPVRATPTGKLSPEPFPPGGKGCNQTFAQSRVFSLLIRPEEPFTVEMDHVIWSFRDPHFGFPCDLLYIFH